MSKSYRQSYASFKGTRRPRTTSVMPAGSRRRPRTASRKCPPSSGSIIGRVLERFSRNPKWSCLCRASAAAAAATRVDEPW